MVIKQYLTEPPIMANPEASDMLYLYLAISDVSVSADLYKEYENRKQRPVFFVRKALYTSLEQATLALHVATKKLYLYF